MREIKFRAWNGVYMDDVIGYDYNCGGVNKDITLVFDKNEGVNRYRTSDLNVMQYTGLKDKNGKEIYEGDIIDIGNGEKFIVGWHEYNQEFTFLNINNNYFDRTYRGETRETWKVIGNIYEDKNLLK